MEKDPSPLDTLRQLKEWLDAGAITQQEFDTLKRKLVFSDTEPTSPASPPAPPIASTPASTPPPAPEYPTLIPPVEESFLPPSATPKAEEPTFLPPKPLTPPPSATVPPWESTAPLRTPSTFTPPSPEVPKDEPLTPRASSPGTPVSPIDSFIREQQEAKAPRPTEPVRPIVPPPAPETTFRRAPQPIVEEEEPYVAPPSGRSPLSTILIVGGIVALLALVAYLVLGNRQSERLTSTSKTEADSVVVQPEVGPQDAQIDLPAATGPETVRVRPAIPPAVSTPATRDSVKAPATAPAPATTPAPVQTPANEPDTPAAEDSATKSDASVTSRVQSLLAAYYEDLKAPPFAAAQYLAPNVERFYTLQNVTPTAINEELTRSHFPEFQEAQTQIEPGSLKVGPVANDGSRVITFLEKSSAFRTSLNKHQQTRAQVRMRLDRNMKISYLRQERLLENTFTD
ncbi:SHOCT domain-containing protein [Hymenobacter jejuensis]|uniref:SHOCT domain-containing protein n=1 Tax=Hymenobacter jejuensis TaxID=2502781 RepID=A0A5B8A298_9BACT|nr:SHOCT domain-containing protein [Hymenobacter jejuensis]QDA60803.1 hypothetical protein FHG12_12125 [Hymenobacter jejuensis]